MVEKKVLTLEESVAKGMSPILDEMMGNGESRYRRMHTDGSGYIRTESGAEGAWQNAHVHRGLIEWYAVQRGWMAYVWLDGAELRGRIYREGEHFATEPGIPHNVYLPENTVIHTVKFGKTSGTDWTAVADLDTASKKLSEADIMSRFG